MLENLARLFNNSSVIIGQQDLLATWVVRGSRRA